MELIFLPTIKNLDLIALILKKILRSAHNLFEVNTKKMQNIKEIFISPIFKYKTVHHLEFINADFFSTTKVIRKLR